MLIISFIKHSQKVVVFVVKYGMEIKKKKEQHRKKTCLRGFRPGPTQTGLYNHSRWTTDLKKVDGLYYPCSEHKGADDLHLCFRI